MFKNDRYTGVNRKMERMALKIIGAMIVLCITWMYAAYKLFE